MTTVSSTISRTPNTAKCPYAPQAKVGSKVSKDSHCHCLLLKKFRLFQITVSIQNFPTRMAKTSCLICMKLSGIADYY